MIKTENIHIVSSYFGPQQIKHILLHIHSYRGCSKLQMGPMEKKKQDKEFIPWHLTKNFDSLSLHTPYLQASFFCNV